MCCLTYHIHITGLINISTQGELGKGIVTTYSSAVSWHVTVLCALQMIFHSKPIAIVLLIDMVALLMYNFSGMCVTGRAPASCLPCMCSFSGPLAAFITCSICLASGGGYLASSDLHFGCLPPCLGVMFLCFCCDLHAVSGIQIPCQNGTCRSL